MAFTTSELWRIKQELGYHQIQLGALPYVDYVAIFESVILPWTEEGADTTSSTTVTATTAPTLTTLTLADSTGFNAHDRVFVGVDASQELVTVQSVSGNAISLHLTKAQSGTYPVTVDGGVARARLIFRHLDDLDVRQGNAADNAGIKRADEVEFFGTNGGKSGVFGDLSSQREYWRRELSTLLGLPYLRGARGGGCRSVEVY